MLAYLLDGLRFVCLEGSWSLQPHEAITLDAALNSLPDETAALARRQLAPPFFIERQSAGRIPCFRFYRTDPDDRFGEPFQTGSYFINVRLKADGRKLTAKCVLHDGRVFGLEFPKPGSFFKKVTLEVISVSCDETGFSYTKVLDRAEHGSGQKT